MKTIPQYPPTGFPIEYLIVAGGGGGGGTTAQTGRGGGGGGAGGFRTGVTTLDVSNVGISISVLVGAGGSGTCLAGATGGNSCFLNLCSTGGGGGGAGSAGGSCATSGGSGGGGGNYDPYVIAGNGNSPPTSPAQGCPGSAGQAGGGYIGSGGGAGQTGVVGSGPSPTTISSGWGGNGCFSSISGSNIAYSGGGGGGVGTYPGFSFPKTYGGIGGGGDGGCGYPATNPSPSANARSGNVNTGGGGGGSAAIYPGLTAEGGSGGSGIVIVRYPGPQRALGGNVTSVGGNTIHTFTSSSNICFLNGFISPIAYSPPICFNYLVVAGGAGGSGGYGGGGGAGGLLYGTNSISCSQCLAVVVGAGGTTTGTVFGGRGSNSIICSTSFGNICTIGGGGGGFYGVNGIYPSCPTGSNFLEQYGGSGGGGSARDNQADTGPGGLGNLCILGQGYPGGSTTHNYGFGAGGGGGGGAAQAGFNGLCCNPGRGGNGCCLTISGTMVAYAGGGGGAAHGPSITNVLAAGGNGGGGPGSTNPGNVNTGGGGGGGTYSPYFIGGNGGSGIVIISYPGSIALATGGTITCAAGNVIHTFTSSGNICFCQYTVF